MQRIEWWIVSAVLVAHAGAVAALWQQASEPAPADPVVMQAVLLSPPAPVIAPPKPTPPMPAAAKPAEKKPVKPRVKPVVPVKSTDKPLVQSATKPVQATPIQAAPSPSKAVAATPAPPTYQAPTAEAQGLNNSAPAYPPTSRKKREQGVVWLQVHVGVQGELLELKLKTSSGFSRLDDAALRAVKQWRFQPALQHGKPVDAWYDLPVRFSLTGL